MTLEILLNEILNDAMCTNNRILRPNSNNIAKFVTENLERYELKLLNIPVVIVSDFCECDGVQDLHAMTGECRKCGKECDY